MLMDKEDVANEVGVEQLLAEVELWGGLELVAGKAEEKLCKVGGHCWIIVWKLCY